MFAGLKTNARSQRILLWMGAVCSLIYALSFGMLMGFWPPVSPGLDATQVVALYAQHNMQFRIGAALMVLTGAFYLPWGIVIMIQMARLEKGIPVWSILQGFASVLGAWLFSFPAILWAITAYMPERAPELTLMMHQSAWLFFVAPSTYFWMQTIPIGIVSVTSQNQDALSAFPRWFGWWCLLTSILADTGIVALLVNAGPFSWNGAIAFYLPLVAASLWMSTLIFLVLRALGKQQQAEQD